MAVPKNRTSKTKTKIRKYRWKKKRLLHYLKIKNKPNFFFGL